MTAIRANSVLPARRTAMTLHTADGLELVAELALPPEREPVATLVCVHPLPTHGGMMDSHVLRKAAARLPALADVAVLRFNTRGTSSAQGTSGGAFDNAVSERFDVAAAIEAAEFDDLPAVWLLGWSFGTDLVLKYGLEPGVVGAVLLSPPLRYVTDEDLARWDVDGRPLTALVPEFDDYLRPDAARERFAVIGQADVVAMPGAKHLWVGDAENVLDRVVGILRPGFGALPRTWSGPMETLDATMYADRTVASFAGAEVPGPPQTHSS